MTRRYLLTGIAAAILLLAGSLGAQPQAAIAEARTGAGEIDFRPLVDFSRATLTVSTPGGQVLRFESEGPLSFGLFDKSGQSRPDGIYTWELRLSPRLSAGQRAELQAARARGERALAATKARLGLTRELVQTGTFRISGGAFVNADEIEPTAKPAAKGLTPSTAADFVINDDLIVDGSACVGFDCVNGEVFGFDTLRLKENNTRIKFDDTSNSASFPNVDWQLTANEANNGGLNKFSIEDLTNSRTPFTIEAGAPSNSLYVEDGGNLGLGTATPAVEVHVKDGDTPTLRLEQDGSSGFTPQTWDLAGNETNFFIRDLSNGSTLPFRIRPGAPTSALDISASGKVGIGTAAPTQELTVKSKASNENVIEVIRSTSTSSPIFRLFETSNGASLMSLFDQADNEDFRLVGTGGHSWMSGTLGLNCDSAAGADFSIKTGTGAVGSTCNTGTFSQITAGATTFTASSSRTIKENISPLQVPGILDKIARVGVYTYDFVEGPKNRVGLMAEDFHTIFGRGSDKMLDGQEVDMALWLAVKELAARNAELSQRLAELEAQRAGGQ